MNRNETGLMGSKFPIGIGWIAAETPGQRGSNREDSCCVILVIWEQFATQDRQVICDASGKKVFANHV